MGTQRSLLGRVVVMKAYRKHGNGAVGSGRRNGTGKQGSIFKVDQDGKRELLMKAEGSTGKAVVQKLRAGGLIPTWVAVSNTGETSF